MDIHTPSPPLLLPSSASPAGFSLAALEELVADNHRLAAAGQERGGQQQAAAQVQALQLENDSLRAQLERSEALRRKGARSLQELVQVRRVLVAAVHWWRGLLEASLHPRFGGLLMCSACTLTSSLPCAFAPRPHLALAATPLSGCSLSAGV